MHRARFQVPRMTDEELRNVTKESFAVKLRAINTGLPSHVFLVGNLQLVFRVMLDRIHLSYNPRKAFAELRKQALAQV